MFFLVIMLECLFRTSAQQMASRGHLLAETEILSQIAWVICRQLWASAPCGSPA
jgi:hypothetical protein